MDKKKEPKRWEKNMKYKKQVQVNKFRSLSGNVYRFFSKRRIEVRTMCGGNNMRRFNLDTNDENNRI